MQNAHRYFPDVQGGVQLLKFTDSQGNFSRKSSHIYSTSSPLSYFNLDNQRADMVFFCLFPMLFLVFNLIYWWSVIQWREETWNTFRSTFSIVFIITSVFAFLLVFVVVLFCNLLCLHLCMYSSLHICLYLFLYLYIYCICICICISIRIYVCISTNVERSSGGGALFAHSKGSFYFLDSPPSRPLIDICSPGALKKL